MFSFLKNIFQKPVAEVSESAESAEAVMEAEAPTAPAATPASSRMGLQSNGRGIELPMQAILQNLPLELQPRIRQSNVGPMTISIPLEKVLSQLSRGEVKVAFGELRQAVPQVFTAGNDRDRVSVSLPLGEIIARLNPALITRRRAQKQVEVPPEISSPFEPRNHSMIFAVGPTKPGKQGEPTPSTSHFQRQTPARPPAPTETTRRSLSSAPTPPAPTALPHSNGPAVIPPSRALRQLNGNKINGPAPTHTPPPSPAPAPKSQTGQTGFTNRTGHTSHTNFNSIAPGPAAPPTNGPLPFPKPAPAKGGPETPPILAGLTGLAEAWPDAVRQEIVQLNLVDAKVALPPEVVERALKQGRIAFTWKMLRSWIKPSPLPTVSAHDGTVLELPLKVVAPLFLARQKESAKSKPQVTVDENIPNLFFGFPQPDVPPAQPPPAMRTADAKHRDTNYYVWSETADTAVVDAGAEKRPSAGTAFTSAHATPNDVVSRASGLDGVAGALVALPDGLMVAHKLPQDVNGETIAAFLPQIFGRVSQCTRELRLGELNNLNFTVGNVPWKIFRVNAIYFAAFGFSGQAMPSSELAALAAELDRKGK